METNLTELRDRAQRLQRELSKTQAIYEAAQESLDAAQGALEELGLNLEGDLVAQIADLDDALENMLAELEQKLEEAQGGA